jgi:hypothetical protein
MFLMLKSALYSIMLVIKVFIFTLKSGIVLETIPDEFLFLIYPWYNGKLLLHYPSPLRVGHLSVIEAHSYCNTCVVVDKFCRN